jgi:hypothetical protein
MKRGPATVAQCCRGRASGLDSLARFETCDAERSESRVSEGVTEGLVGG